MKLALLSAAWLFGVLLGFESGVGLLPLMLMAAASIVVSVGLWLARIPVLPAILVVVLLLGLLRGEAAEAGRSMASPLSGEDVVAVGRIVDDPEATGRQVRIELEISQVWIDGKRRAIDERWLVYASPDSGLVSLRNPPYFRYGDEVRIAGVPQAPKPFEGFDYAAYLSARGISATMFARDATVIADGGFSLRAAIYAVRGRLAQSIESAMPYPESALASAMLLGKRADLPPDMVEQFRGTGASHMLAISGLHVGVLMAVALGSAAWLLGRQRPAYLVVAGIAVWLYALVAGAPPSALRAAAMGTVYLVALGVGRPASVLPALALAAALMTAVSPMLIRQVGFQLSFAAVGGIALALAVLGGRIGWGGPGLLGWLKRLSGTVVALAVVSAAATLATWPLVAVNFGQVALLSVPVSLVAVPAMAPLIISAFAAGAGGLAFGPLGQLLGWIATAPAAYMIAVVSAFPPWTVEASWVGKPLMAGWYGGLAGMLLAAQPHRTHRWRQQLHLGLSRARTMFSRTQSQSEDAQNGGIPRWPLPAARISMGVAAVLAIAAAILWLRMAGGPDGNLHVHFLDVGQGDSTLIVTPSGKQVLVDGGPDGDLASQRLAGVLPGGDRSLDLVVMTHLDSDHSRGLLEVLDRYSVGAVLQGAGTTGGDAGAEWEQRLGQHGISAVAVRAGYTVQLGDGVELTVLNPASGSRFGDSNNDSVALRLTYWDFSVLLAADIEEEAERGLVNGGVNISSTVLKVGHHGSNTSSTGDFLEAVAPAIAVISAGSGNPYGHPASAVVDRLEAAVGAEGVYRTDLHGSIEVVSDGSATWVKTER